MADPACAEDLRLATNPFNETVSETALIAGQFVAGLQVSSAPGADMKLSAYIPDNWSGEVLCARVVTVEGRYLASNEYAVPSDWPGDMSLVPYPKTELNAALVGRPDHSVGVRLSHGPCSAQVTEVAMTIWGEGTDQPELLVNSFQAERVFLYQRGNITPTVCAPAGLDTQIAYDTVCPLPAGAPSGKVEVSILRIVDGNAAPPEDMILWLP